MSEQIIGKIVFPADPSDLSEYGSMSALVAVPHEIPKSRWNNKYERHEIRFWSKPGEPLGNYLSSLVRGDEVTLGWNGAEYKPLMPAPGAPQRQPIATPAPNNKAVAAVEPQSTHKPLMDANERNAFLMLVDQYLDLLIAGRTLLGTKDGSPDIDSQPAQAMVSTAFIQSMKEWGSKRAGLLAVSREESSGADYSDRESSVVNAGSQAEAINFIHLGTSMDLPGSHVIAKTLNDVFNTEIGNTPDEWLQAAKIFWHYSEQLEDGVGVKDAIFKTKLDFDIRDSTPAPWG